MYLKLVFQYGWKSIVQCEHFTKPNTFIFQFMKIMRNLKTFKPAELARSPFPAILASSASMYMSVSLPWSAGAGSEDVIRYSLYQNSCGKNSKRAVHESGALLAKNLTD